MENIAKLTSYGCYLDCDFMTAKYPDDEVRIVGNVAEYVYDLEQKISDLETKLAESEERVKDLEFRNKNLEHSLKVAPNANAGQRARIVELKEINHKLKQQLAEKEKEITRLKQLVDGFDELKQYDKNSDLILINPKNYYVDGYRLVLKADDYDKISFAVEQLEKVRTQFRTKYSWYEETHRVCEKTDNFVIWLDNQIKQLKENNNRG